MAIRYSSKQLLKAKKNYYGKIYSDNVFLLKEILHLFKKIKIRIINYKNYLIRIKKKLFYKNNSKNIPDLSFKHLSEDNILKSSKNFLENGYCYLENFINESLYLELKRNWPDKCFFYEADSPEKNYNFAFRYCVNKNFQVYPKKELENLKFFEVHKKFYYYLENSKEFSNLLSKISKSLNYKFYSTATSYAKEGSYLIPHIDSVYDSNSISMLNMIFFIDGGSEPGKSGGTGIYKDADFEKPLLVPHCLENSVLIYNSKNDFYHGFDVMSKDTFRHAITFQFIQE